jgi:hypothetical protein
MTFTVNWSKDIDDRAPGGRQIFAGCLNVVHEYVQSVGGIDTINKQGDNVPRLKGITKWARKKYGISIIDQYATRIEPHACLSPNPMDEIIDDNTRWRNPAYIPYDLFNPPWGYRQEPTKDELRLFMDPVFIGPRSKSDRKFFHGESIKLGLRKKHRGPSHWAYEDCQTPELRRWQEDVKTSRAVFADQGGVSATEWATERGWKEGRFWNTTHLDVDSFNITMPGCKGKPDTYEKLLFVMRFAGKN